MQMPLQITMRDITMTPSIEQAIKEKVSKLERFYDRIMGCHVLIEAPHKHSNKGNTFNIRIRMTVPGGELVVKREPREDFYVALRDTFTAARRQLQAFARRRRGEVKHHEAERRIPVEDELEG